MYRRVDQHVERRPVPSNVSKLNLWRDAWLASFHVVDDANEVDYRQFHFVFERWMGLLNRIFEHPISNMHRYQVRWYYFLEPCGPKEIVHLYFDETRTDDDTRIVHCIFNAYEFQKTLTHYCSDLFKCNRAPVDEARGTIDTSFARQNAYRARPANYLKNATTWSLLWAIALHAMAHWDVFDTYEHAHYDTHMHVRESPFFHLRFYGQVVWK